MPGSKLLIWCAIVTPIVVFISCVQKEEPRVTSKNELAVFLDSLERRYENACLGMGLANWNSYAKEGLYDLDAAKAYLVKIFSDTAAHQIIDEWKRKSNSLADKLLARRLDLWQRCFIGSTIYSDPEIAALENSLQQKITNFKFTFEGSQISRSILNNRLREEKKQSRRHKLWSVTSQLSAVTAPDLIQLVKLRNKKARQLGFPNYYSLALHLQAVDEEWLLKTLNILEENTRTAFGEYADAFKKKLRIENLGPWDFDIVLRDTASIPDRYFPQDSVFAVIHEFQKGIGFDVDSLPIKEVTKDIPYNALSIAINIPDDSRIMINPTKGKGFYSAAFSQYGHCLKAVHTRVEYPILKGYEWIPGAQCAAYEEGIAEMHGEFTDDSLWLSKLTKAKPKTIDKYTAGRGLPTMYRMRQLLKDFFIEYEMYKNPEQDMALLEREMLGKYLLTTLNDSLEHQFAASVPYAFHPCYYHNCILAGMIAAQLQEALTSKFGAGKIENPKAASWMIDHLYATGETEEWTERMRNATGKSLETGAYLRKLGIWPAELITKQKND